jgi:4-diphosphocytidyl-2C-methyl-D-erythritol kinase
MSAAGIHLPRNAFARALYALQPALAAIPDEMTAAGAPAVALSGAGPSHYAIFSQPEQAQRVAGRLGTALGGRAEVRVAEPVVKPPPPVPTYHA